MAKRVPTLAVIGAVAVVIVGGCTDSTGGEATPGDRIGTTESTAPAGESSSGGEPTEELPSRPRELSVDGLEPCSLLTEAQLGELKSQLQFDAPPRSHTSEDRYQAPTCGLEQSGEPFDSIDLMLVTSEGVEPWLAGDRNVDSWLVSVGGFPAVDYKLRGSTDVECATSVDVAGGQQLIVDFIPFERRDYKQLCQITEQVAGMAVQTLQTLR